MKNKGTKITSFLLVGVLAIWLLIAFFPLGGETQVYNSDPEQKGQTYEPKFKDEGDLMFFNESDSLLVQIDIEIADNEQDIGYGLMYRKQMDDLNGMIFLMPIEEKQSFWMKNTFIPLDILFVNSEKRIVDISKNNQALDETPVESKEIAVSILELNAGFADKYGIKIGDRIDLQRN